LLVEQADNNQAKKALPLKKKEPNVNQIQNHQTFTPRHPLSTPKYQSPSFNPNLYPSYQTFIFPNPPNQNFPNLSTTPMQINHIPSPQPYTSTHPTYNNYHPTYAQNRPNRPTPRPTFQNPGQLTCKTYHLSPNYPFPMQTFSSVCSMHT